MHRPTAWLIVVMTISDSGCGGRPFVAPEVLVGTQIVRASTIMRYSDGRPSATYRLNAVDQGAVLLHGDGPDQSDLYGARDVWVFKSSDNFYLHYDGAGPLGWLVTLAMSTDLHTWHKMGTVLKLGDVNAADSASASYGTTFFDGQVWHMFYLGTPNASPPPDRVPEFPYQTLKAEAQFPSGPWRKDSVVPFTPKEGTYYNNTASPGHIIQNGSQYLQFFSAGLPRTISIARTNDLESTWTIDAQPALPPTEQIENSSLYFQASSGTWFLFTNHIGISDSGQEYADAIWVYWTQNLNRWNPNNKAVVLDGSTCSWSKVIIGSPSVIQIGDELSVLYDGLQGSTLPAGTASHMNRDVGLAFIRLPIHLPPQ